MVFSHSDKETIAHGGAALSNKFPRMMHYIVSKYGSRGVPKAILAKLCYFSDFDNYELYATPITDEHYCKEKHGPLAAGFRDSYEMLADANRIRIDEIETAGGKKMLKCVSIAEPDITCLSERDIETIEWVFDRYGNYTPRQISDTLQKDIPWSSTRIGGIIDYELVFYRNNLTSVSEDETEDSDSSIWC
jgi:uncharacterized phage-associated protein